MNDIENINDFHQSQVEKEEDNRFFRINNRLTEISYIIDDLQADNLTPYDIIQDIIDYRISTLTHKVSHHLQNEEKDIIYDLLKEIEKYNKIKNRLQ